MKTLSHIVSLAALGAAAYGAPQFTQSTATLAPAKPAQSDVHVVSDPDPTQPALELSDDVPLPVRPVIASSNAGDVVIAPASGDPYFLAFTAGAYYPPPGERIDPALLASVPGPAADQRAARETFAFAMLSKRVTPARVAALEALGCRVLGFHPHYALKVAIPVAAIDSVAALDFVHWLGVPRTWQKVHPRLVQECAQWPAGKPIDVYIDVFDSDLCTATVYTPFGTLSVGDPGCASEPVPDQARARVRTCMSNGWQQLALEGVGVEVLEYVDRIRAFRARVMPQAVEQLVGLDFVQFVEVDLPDQLAHDESMPLTLLDYGRSQYDGDDLNVASVGQVDSGIDTAHSALDNIFSFAFDSTGEGVNVDPCGHGTHIAGTILGKPLAASLGLSGAAPGLGATQSSRYFNVKKHSGAACTSSGASLSSLFSHFRNDFVDIFGNTSPRPHVVNNSYGLSATIGNPWVGSEAQPRTIDAEVWDHSQLYVFSAGNEGGTIGASSIRLEGSAKNALTVGSVHDWFSGTRDPGEIATSSSRGPCGDGRFKPNVTAPGSYVTSAQAGTFSNYTARDSTSHAAAHVTGLAAQLCDHYTLYQYNPERLASLIMATSIPFEDERLTTQASATASIDHLNQYGTGRINADGAHFSYDNDVRVENHFSAPLPGNWAHHDFDVDVGCVRLIVLFTYHEDECSAGAAQALVNDYDLFIDSPQNGIDPANNTGEYTAQQSSVDNTEIRTLDNPMPGTWRYKLWPTSTTGSIRTSVTVVQIFGDTTPNGTLTVAADDVYVQPNDDVEITATVDSPTYFGEALFLDSTSTGDVLQSATTTLADGAVTNLMGNLHNGRDIEIGTVRIDETRSGQWVTRWATEGLKTFSVEARSDNWVDETQSVQIYVDGTPPTMPTGLTSTTHTPNVWSTVNQINFTWNAAQDFLSGLSGYSRVIGPLAVMPDTVQDIPAVTNLNATVGNGTFYLNLRPVDRSGNWPNGFVSTGPYKIDNAAPLGPTNVTSPTHAVGVVDCSENLYLQWTAATDAVSGLAGYLIVLSPVPDLDPTGPLNFSASTTDFSVVVPSSPTARYVHLRARDNAGNYGTTVHFGPILVLNDAVSTYCTAKTNSLGCLPAIASNGTPSLSAGGFTVTCTNVINNKNGLLFWGRTQTAVPFDGGWKCVAAPTVRTPIQGSGGSLSGNDCTGSYAFTFSTSYMNSVGIVPGDTIYCQHWMRDPPSPSTTGLSNALQFTVCD